MNRLRILLLLLISAIGLRAEQFSLSQLSDLSSNNADAAWSSSVLGPFDFGDPSSYSQITGSSDHQFVGLLFQDGTDDSGQAQFKIWFIDAEDFFAALRSSCGGLWRYYSGHCAPPASTGCDTPGSPGTGGGDTGGGGGTSPVPDSTGIMTVIATGVFFLMMAKVLRDRSRSLF